MNNSHISRLQTLFRDLSEEEYEVSMLAVWCHTVRACERKEDSEVSTSRYILLTGRLNRIAFCFLMLYTNPFDISVALR